MKITVVTISFNQARYLQACIDSVRIQEGPWEHIVVDPGSTDGSLEIIKSRREHFSHVVIEPDSGPAHGLIKGFALATGDIFYYLNSDDVVLPGTFSEVRRLLSVQTDIDVISAGAYVIDEIGNFGRQLWSDSVTRCGLAHGGSILIQPSTFFRRSAYESAGGFNPENKSNWDGELVVDMFLSGARFRNWDGVWSCYRVHGESITGSSRLDERIRRHSRRMHERITGRKQGLISLCIGLYFRVIRVVRHPRIIIQRIRFGRVYGARKT